MDVALTNAVSVRSSSTRSVPLSRVAAVRETSVLFAVVLGAVVLREPVGASRIAGTVLVVVGVALVALG